MTLSATAIERAKNQVTKEIVADYCEQGAVCLRGLLSSDELAILANGIQLNIATLSERAKIASHKNDSGLFIEDFCNWQTNTHYREIIFNSPISVVAGLLMQSHLTRLYHDHLLIKEKNTEQRTPWHQDQPYYNIAGLQNCSLWIPIDPISKLSSLEFISGSHRGPWLMPRTFMDNQAKWFPEGSLKELPDIEAARHEFPIISWEIEPGDVVCFHMLTLHAAGGTQHAPRRRVFSVRFLGDDMTHAPRAWATSPNFPGLENELAAGAPMQHRLFPVVWIND